MRIRVTTDSEAASLGPLLAWGLIAFLIVAFIPLAIWVDAGMAPGAGTFHHAGAVLVSTFCYGAIAIPCWLLGIFVGARLRRSRGRAR